MRLRAITYQFVQALVTDGVDAALLNALKAALKAEGAMLRLIAPEVGGVEASDGTWIGADEKIEGGPSVLFDAIALLTSPEGATALAMRPAARDFVADAFSHQKMIAHVDSATPLLAKAGVAEHLDDGFIPIKTAPDCESFVTKCRKLRIWTRPSPDR